MIREAPGTDVPAITSIYNHYILNSTISFEEEVLQESAMAERIERVQDAGFNWLVAQEKDVLLGYAYSDTWNPRAAYRHTAEVSVYLAQEHASRGVGTQLYQTLFTKLQEQGIHTIIGGIALPNPHSVALHEKFGMQQVAHFKAVGYKFGQWIDVGYWQVSLRGANT